MGGMHMEQKPLVVVNGLVRKDAIAYLKEHVEVRQWTEKTVMPREVHDQVLLYFLWEIKGHSTSSTNHVVLITVQTNDMTIVVN